MLFLRRRGKGDATSHYAARWLRLAAAVGSVKWPSSRRPSPTINVSITNRKCQLYPFPSLCGVHMRACSSCAAPCTYPACTDNHHSAAFRLYIPPRNPGIWPISRRYVQEIYILAPPGRTYPVCTLFTPPCTYLACAVPEKS